MRDVTLHFTVGRNAHGDELVEDLKTAVDEDEGITLHIAGRRYTIELDAIEVDE